MSMDRRLDKAFHGWWQRAEQARWLYGLVGRVNDDATVTITVAERPDFVYVRMGSGESQTLAMARNQGRVPLRAGLPVKMRREAGVLIIEDVDRSGLLEDDANAPGTVYSVNSLTGDVVLDSDDIAEGVTNLYMTAAGVATLIDGATAKTTPVDADTMPLIDSAASNVLKKVTWANIKATLKTYFDTLYELAGAIATHAALTATHGATGAIVGTTNSQDLTSKKIVLRAGSAGAGGAPLKFTAGTNLTTPESGAIEFDGTDFFITI